jgi:tripartite-type tricarboxylate transporter receptor subunit TctC
MLSFGAVSRRRSGLMGMLNIGLVLPPVRHGVIKAHAVTARRRLAAAPEIPTVDEAGFPGLYSSVWFGFWAPAKTPKDAIVRLNSATVEALADPAVRARLGDLAQEIFPREQQTPEALEPCRNPRSPNGGRSPSRQHQERINNAISMT